MQLSERDFICSMTASRGLSLAKQIIVNDATQVQPSLPTAKGKERMLAND